jgi:hypothetical protein
MSGASKRTGSFDDLVQPAAQGVAVDRTSALENVGFQFPALYQRQFSNYSPLKFPRPQKPNIPRLPAETCVLPSGAKAGKTLSREPIFSKAVCYVV